VIEVVTLFFEHLTFQVVDAPELNVSVYTPLDEAETPAKLAQLLSEQSSAGKQGSEHLSTSHDVIDQPAWAGLPA